MTTQDKYFNVLTRWLQRYGQKAKDVYYDEYMEQHYILVDEEGENGEPGAYSTRKVYLPNKLDRLAL